MKKIWKKTSAYMLIFAICVSSVYVPTYAEETYTIETKTTEAETNVQTDTNVETNEISTVVEDETEDEVWDQITTKEIFVGENYKITYTLNSYWNTGYNASIRIENTGDSIIQNWYVKFENKNEITNIWNAMISENIESEYVIKNASWNQDINVGGYVEFGISGNGTFQGFPENYELLSTVAEAKQDDYKIEYILNSDWGSGFTATIQITNNSDTVLEDWMLELDFARDITNIWNGVIEEHEDNHYVIRNAGYNGDIAPKQTISFGFNGNNGSKEFVPSNYKFYKYAQTEEVIEREKEPLASIGEAYVKDPTENNVVIDEETGLQYAKNQLLVSAYMGADKAIFEEIAQEVGAEIVGYIALTNDYQFEFVEDKCFEEIMTIAEYIDSYSFVSNVSLNIVSIQETELTTSNDALYNDGKTCFRNKVTHNTEFNTIADVWDVSNPQGDNWGLEALRVPCAWDEKETFSPVKVGVYDLAFDTTHEDLIFDDIVNNSDLSNSDKHGTYVAGILAAQHNNNKGISGVATDTRLYAYASSGNEYGSSMRDKLVYATLIGNHVKVINVSIGLTKDIIFAANHPEIDLNYCNKARNLIQTSASILEEYLKKLLSAGYDFVICTSAGNTNSIQFVVDTNETYGIRKASNLELKDSTITKYSGGILAYYDCGLTAITDIAVKNRIIVVGAMEKLPNGSYAITDFSNIGKRVDVIAPGKEILSTAPKTVDTSGYAVDNGTSIASPYVASLVALMYQVNPSMKGSYVKTYLKLGSPKSLSDGTYSYQIPDAVECSNYAKNGYKTDNNDNDIPSGIVCGFTKDYKENVAANVKITANRESTGEYNLDEYNEYSFTFESDSKGYYLQTLPQGTYTFVISKEGYLPYAIQGVVVNPDETTYMENIVLSKWISLAYSGSAVQGTVKDALKGTMIEGASIKLRKGWNNKTGAYVKNILGSTRNATTASDGTFSIHVSVGTYTAEVSKDGYVTGYYNVISGDTDTLSVLAKTTMILSPVLSEDEYRIVLTWGDTPNDLDSHLTYYVEDTQQCHVYYSNKIGRYNDEKIAQLDLDDTSAYGPETITMTLDTSLVADGSEFKYSVHDFTNRGNSTSSTLSLSNATVRVYAGNDIIKTFNIPKDEVGTVWHVFDITEDGIKSVNEFYNAATAMEVE